MSAFQPWACAKAISIPSSGRRGPRADPLLAAANELSILRARSPEHARELAAWTGRMFRCFAVDETEEEARYRQAACPAGRHLLARPSRLSRLAGAHIIAHSTFTRITAQRPRLYRAGQLFPLEGLNDDGVPRAGAIAGPKYSTTPSCGAACCAVVYLFSASMPGIVPHSRLRRRRTCGRRRRYRPSWCRVPARPWFGERLEGRLQQLSKLTGKRLGLFRIG